MQKIITESEIEEASLEVLKDLNYKIIYGPDISEGGVNEERSYNEVILVNRLRNALEAINPNIPKEAIEEVIKNVRRTESQNLVFNNQQFHRAVMNGLDIEYKRKDGSIKGDKIWLFDFNNIENNEFLAVNQFTIIENDERRPDIVLFINGLPLVLIELKNIADENATIWTAFKQFETYKQQIPSIFNYNEILIVSDGLEARAGTVTSNRERFMQWKTINDKKILNVSQLEVLLKGMLNKETLLDLIRNFIAFEIDKSKKSTIINIEKKIAAYHQYNAVNKAVSSTIKATKTDDKRAGVIWHTQGSGKSLIMLFYVGKLVLQPELENPTVILLTDRNDLDDQLYGTFGRCHEILRQKPKQAESREEIKEFLKVSSGGIIFTTIQKFLPEIKGEHYPLLSDRKNIIVIADEAHRSQYDFIDGFAKHIRDALPNASFIGFTGTPIENADKNTPAVFGKYVDVYDFEQAVNDGATVRIFYESRLAKLDLKPEKRPTIDKEFEEVTEEEEIEGKEKLKSKWARLEKVAGAPRRIKRIAKDIVNHFEKRISVLEGKGMIVCMSRRICVDLYNEIIKLKPEWHNKDYDKGFVKIVMTGSASDPKERQEHIRNKSKRKEIGDNLKDPSHELKLIIVRDMFLTGFDAPILHTMYLDKPMRGHTLMQAIARVNRVYKDKQGGLIVDYMGIGVELKKALMDYTRSGGKGKPTFDQEQAVNLMLEKYEVIRNMFHGFNYKRFFELKPKDKISFIPQAMEHILKEKDKKERFNRETLALLKAFSLAVPHEKAMKIREEVGFFQVIKSALSKTTETKKEDVEKFDSAIKQILSKAVISDRIVDIFEAVGIKKPDISILSEGFLAEVKELPQKNLAFEALKKLLNDEIRLITKRNIVQGKSFMEMLDKTIKKYMNRTVEAAQVVEELIDLARKVRDERNRGKDLKMREEEIAFYDALEVNDSAVKVLGNETLRKIALELTDMIRNSVTIDWTLRESVQATIRLKVKKILRKYGYPPDKEKRATETVLKQAETIAKNWAEKY